MLSFRWSPRRVPTSALLRSIRIAVIRGDLIAVSGWPIARPCLLHGSMRTSLTSPGKYRRVPLAAVAIVQTHMARKYDGASITEDAQHLAAGVNDVRPDAIRKQAVLPISTVVAS